MIGLHMPKQSFVSWQLMEKGYLGPTNTTNSSSLDIYFSHLGNMQTIHTDSEICWSMLGYLVVYKIWYDQHKQSPAYESSNKG